MLHWLLYLLNKTESQKYIFSMDIRQNLLLWLYDSWTKQNKTQLTCVHKVILLHPHLAAADHIGDDVLQWSVLVDAICPLIDGHHIPVLLVQGSLPGLGQSGSLNIEKWRRENIYVYE